MSKGIIIFASNNGLLDYVKIACASAGFAEKTYQDLMKSV